MNGRRRPSHLEEGVHDAEGGEEEEVGEDDERQADGEEHAVTQHDAEAPQREDRRERPSSIVPRATHSTFIFVPQSFIRTPVSPATRARAPHTHLGGEGEALVEGVVDQGRAV